MLKIKYKTIQLLAKTDFSQEGIAEFTEEDETISDEMKENRPAEELVEKTKPVNLEISRNDLCPCGSGLKYKHCCGKLK